MHLDCVFGLLSETCCICYEDMLGEHSPKKRLVDEYSMVSGTRSYEKTREGIEFGAYLADNNIHVITIPHEAQVRLLFLDRAPPPPDTQALFQQLIPITFLAHARD